MARKTTLSRSEQVAKSLHPRPAGALEADQIRGGLKTPRFEGAIQKASMDEE